MLLRKPFPMKEWVGGQSGGNFRLRALIGKQEQQNPSHIFLLTCALKPLTQKKKKKAVTDMLDGSPGAQSGLVPTDACHVLGEQRCGGGAK